MGSCDTGEPLTAASDNLHMGTLAEIARIAGHDLLPGVGDSIDRGLIVLRLLNEAGYDVIPRAGAPIFNAPQQAEYLPTREQYREILTASPEAGEVVAYREWCLSDKPHQGGWWQLVEKHDGDHAIATGGGKALQPLFTRSGSPAEDGALRKAITKGIDALREPSKRPPALLYNSGLEDAKRVALDALSSEDGAVEAGLIRMLTDDRERMRRAGNALAAAACRVTDEYDGVHRLKLATADWNKAVADEGGRGDRFARAQHGEATG